MIERIIVERLISAIHVPALPFHERLRSGPQRPVPRRRSKFTAERMTAYCDCAANRRLLGSSTKQPYQPRSCNVRLWPIQPELIMTAFRRRADILFCASGRSDHGPVSAVQVRHRRWMGQLNFLPPSRHDQDGFITSTSRTSLLQSANHTRRLASLGITLKRRCQHYHVSIRYSHVELIGETPKVSQ